MSTTAAVTRADLDIDGRRVSYLDFGGPGRPVLALHGHLEEAATWTEVAEALAPEWRVIAPDQRGHGDSDRVTDYAAERYVEDAVTVIERLGLGRVPVVGHSGRGVTAYQLAARRADLVSALVVEEAGAVIGGGGLDFCLAWPEEADSKEELLAALGPAGPLFADALRPRGDGGWRLPFVPRDMVDSERQVHGDHWADWLASDHPALLIAGNRQPCLDPAHAREMAARRPSTRLVTLNTDHFAHKADPTGFARAVRDFLATAA